MVSYKKQQPQPQPQPALAPTGSSRPQPKVYKVKPIHFRELVQQLTGAPAQAQAQAQARARTQSQSQSGSSSTRRSTSLQRIAPPPLPLHHHNQTRRSTTQQMQPTKTAEAAEQKPVFGGFDSTTELTLSPNFQSWFAFAMLSPGAAALSQKDQTALV